MQPHEILLDRAVERANEEIGQPGERLAGLLRRHRPGQDPGADQEHVLLGEDADAVEEVLVGRCLRERAVEPGGERRLLRQRAEEARIDHRIHHLGKLRQAVGQPRRGRQHQRDQGDELGILPQQRVEPPAPLQGADEAIERLHGRVRIARAGEWLHQLRQELGELRAGEAAAQRGGAAGEPMPQARRHLGGLPEAHLGQPREGLAVVGVGRETASRGCEPACGACSNRSA